MLLDRLLARARPSAEERAAAWRRLGAALSAAPPEPGQDDPSDVPPAAPARLDPGRAGLAALAAAAALAVAVTAVLLLRGRPAAVPAPAVVAPAAARPSPSAAWLVVDVAGKVRHPGVVRLPAGSRVADAVAAAGGPMPGVDVGLLNLAARLSDGEQVLVGVAPAPGAAGATSAGAAGGALDLNAATADQLEALPGVGPVLAQRIVDWRAAHGGFRSVGQLRQVSGIGERKFADLRDLVRV